MKKTTSKNKEAEKICGLRPVGRTPFDLPCELHYCCPICHPKTRQFDETLNFSEYNFFMYCPNCNIDIPSMLCLKANTKKEVEIYTERFLGIIKQVKKEIHVWSENWFDEKRIDNDMWRMNQDELTSLFLDELKNKFVNRNENDQI